MFPQGLSEQFSLVFTFRLRTITKKRWCMLEIQDNNQVVQMQVLFNAREETMEFSLISNENKLNTVKFKSVPVRTFQ